MIWLSNRKILDLLGNHCRFFYIDRDDWHVRLFARGLLFLVVLRVELGNGCFGGLLFFGMVGEFFGDGMLCRGLRI